MKRFLLFAWGDIYQPRGGIHDFRGDFDTVEEARRARAGLNLGSADCAHIFDTEECRVVDVHWPRWGPLGFPAWVTELAGKVEGRGWFNP